MITERGQRIGQAQGAIFTLLEHEANPLLVAGKLPQTTLQKLLESGGWQWINAVGKGLFGQVLGYAHFELEYEDGRLTAYMEASMDQGHETVTSCPITVSETKISCTHLTQALYFLHRAMLEYFQRHPKISIDFNEIMTNLERIVVSMRDGCCLLNSESAGGAVQKIKDLVSADTCYWGDFSLLKGEEELDALLATHCAKSLVKLPNLGAQVSSRPIS